MAGHAETGREGQEIIVPLGVPRGREGDCAQRAGVESVGWVRVCEQLHVGAKFESHGVEIGGCDPGDEGNGTQGRRDTSRRGEHVEATDNVGHHVYHEDFGKPFERQTVNTRAEALLDRANRPLNFADVTVSRDHIHVNGVKRVADASELVVNMKVADPETTAVIELDDSGNFLQDGGACAIGHGADCAKMDVARDGV